MSPSLRCRIRKLISNSWSQGQQVLNVLNRAFLGIFEDLLVLQNFFRAKLPPGTAKTVFANPKGPPFGC